VEFKDYYKVMGVARDATEAQIKQAYRKLARKYHPDVSKEKDAEARFKEVGEAYEVLKSPEKRAAYDQLGQNHRPGEDFRPPPDWDAGFEFSGAGPGNSSYSDFFDSLFGAQARSGRRADFHAGNGEDHHAKVLLDLEASIVAVKELSHQVWLSGLQLFQGGPFQKKAGGQIALQLAQDFQSQREIFFERSGNLLYAAFALLDCSAAILRQSFQQAGLNFIQLEGPQAVPMMTEDVQKQIAIQGIAFGATGEEGLAQFGRGQRIDRKKSDEWVLLERPH